MSVYLLLEDFPKNHNLVLLGQPELLKILQRSDHHDIRSRITQSADFKSLSPAGTQDFIHQRLDDARLPHNTFTAEAINLISKATNGNLRAIKNLCIGAMVEAIRTQRHAAFAAPLTPRLRRSKLHFAWTERSAVKHASSMAL